MSSHTCPSTAFTGDAPIGKCGPLLWGHCFFPWLLCTWGPVCTLRVEFLFSWVRWNSQPIPLVFKTTFRGLTSSSFCCQTPSWGAWCGAQNFYPVGELLWYNCFPFQFVGYPSGVYGIWFYHDCVPPTVFLWFICLWSQGIFLGRLCFFFCPWLFSSSLRLVQISAQSCKWFGFLEEEVRHRPSARTFKPKWEFYWFVGSKPVFQDQNVHALDTYI